MAQADCNLFTEALCLHALLFAITSIEYLKKKILLNTKAQISDVAVEKTTVAALCEEKVILMSMEQ